MNEANPSYARSLGFCGALIVVAHFIVALWHLFLVVKTQPGFPTFAPPLLILVNLLPVMGAVVLAKRLPKLAGILIAIPLGIALVIGLYAHFLNPGTDNVFRMPRGKLTLPFQISAAQLVVLEAAGVWFGLVLFAKAKSTR